MFLSIYLLLSLSVCILFSLHFAYILPTYMILLILYRFSFGCKEAKLLCKNVENI